MPPEVNFDLTDKGWVESYIQKCESLMKEFTKYVYALQTHCVHERRKCVNIANHCKRLKVDVKKLVQEKNQLEDQINIKTALCTTLESRIASITANAATLEGDAEENTFNNGSPALLNMAMNSEQLQMDMSAMISPAQHRADAIVETEKLNSPRRASKGMENMFQHNTSPTCKLSENKSALGFLTARGRVGKVPSFKSNALKLREHNCTDEGGQRKKECELQVKHTDWLEKVKGEERRGTLKRVATVLDDTHRKRGLLSLNKSGERKMKQSRLTQIVAMRQNRINNEKVSNLCDVADAQKLTCSPSTPSINTNKKQLAFPSLQSDTDDIFNFSSDDDSCTSANANALPTRNAQQIPTVNINMRSPLNETNISESVLAITPTAPQIICLDQSQVSDEVLADEVQIGREANNKPDGTKVGQNAKVKREKGCTQKLSSELAAAMLAEWQEETESSLHDVKAPALRTKAEPDGKVPEVKSHVSQQFTPKISIKERFNVDCHECQKYIDFMGVNMSLGEIEEHLRRCTLHRERRDGLPDTPPDYWNPLMPSFSDSDPRNQTLSEDPYVPRKCGSNRNLQ